MKRSGAPRTADMPGGSGSTLGAANRSIRAPKARSPNAFSTSPMLMAGLGRLARSLRTSENRCRGSASSSIDMTVERLLEGSGMVLSIVARTKQCEGESVKSSSAILQEINLRGLAQNQLTDDRQKRSSAQRLKVVSASLCRP